MENKKYEPFLGVCPIGKTVFSFEESVIQKNQLLEELKEWGISFCDINGILPNGLVNDQHQVDMVVEFFKGKKVDALFIPHCNFGTEGAAGMIAKKLGIPVLLWGPRDDSPLADGSRLRDSLCGMFATSKVLNKLKVPFTYIENCNINDTYFKDKFNNFINAVSVVKAMKNMRIGKIGARIDTFWSTITNESDLLDKFGIEIIQFDMIKFIDDIKARASKDIKKYENELENIKKWMTVDGLENENGLLNSLAMRDEMLFLAEVENLDVFAINNSNSIPEKLGPGNGLGDSLLQDLIPVACECDVAGAVSSVLIRAASGSDEPVFFPDITVRHPTNENAVLLWHGTAPFSLRHEEYLNKVKLLPPWIQKELPPYYLNYRLKDGPITVCRFDGEDGDFRLGFGKGNTVPGPYTKEFYVWLEVNNWSKWERAIIEGPYIHHCSCAYGHFTDVFEEACKYIPGLTPQKFGE